MARRKQQAKASSGVFSSAIVRAAALLLGGYLVVSLIVNQVEITARRQELNEAHQQLEDRIAQNEELARVLESGDEQELIERIARDELGYARPNERVFVEISGK